MDSISSEDGIECVDGVDNSIQQKQRGGNEEIANENSVERNVLAAISSLDGIASKRGASRKQQHWKSQSVGESMMTQQQLQLSHTNSLSTATTTTVTTMTTTVTPDDESQQEQQQTTNFSANRELWQRRATSQTQLMNTTVVPPTPKSSYSRVSQEFREMRQKHTPDLVMDLPLSAQDPVGKKSASSSSLSSSDDETMMMPQQQAPPSRAEAATSPTGGPESPDMSTAAERFAKQNQCTLKKNTKTANTAETITGNKLKRIETAEQHDGTGVVVVVDAEDDEIIRSASSNQIAVDGGNGGGEGGGGGGVPLRSPLPPRSTPKIVAKFADMHLTGGSQVVSSFKPQVKVKPTILRKPVIPFPHPHMSPELARKIEKQAQSAEQAN